MEKSIIVEHLSKTFNVKQKEPGFLAGVKSLFKPEYKEVNAVIDMSFTVNEGEALAFIGPNGAGKSTAIKILTGIMQPTSGSVSVVGLNPGKQRQQVAQNIGCVFGQKSQLSFHLPALDSFHMLGHIYGLSDAERKSRIAFLLKAFDIEDIVKSPVRKLSLGQRMRCEVAASLLHRPKVIFLDEPTIGLDVIAKQQVRDILMQLNKQEGVTIFLTSHDAGDIESVTQRTIMVNHGIIVFDDETSELKRTYLTKKVIDLVFEEKADTFNFESGTILERGDHRISVEVNAQDRSIEQLLAYTFAHFTVVDVTVFEAPLEHIIARLYREKRIG
jgi:ABC-2 type transport system ATP-binding protein